MISKKEVEHVAKLARLGFSWKEIEKMQKELTLILDYFDLLKEVNVSQVTPTSHSIVLENVDRKDITKEESSETVNKILAGAPAKEKGHIRVKGILG